jgi:hypothetical protein
MKKLTNTNHNPPEGYELFMDVKDTLGRSWKFCAAPVGSGSVAYFSKLSDYVRWVRQVEQIRAFARGELSFREKVMVELWSGNMWASVAEKALANAI